MAGPYTAIVGDIIEDYFKIIATGGKWFKTDSINFPFQLLHAMVSVKNTTFRADLMDFDNIMAYEEYQDFNIENEANYYRLTVGKLLQAYHR